MSAAVLISGTIFRAPERRVSKAGKPFVSATVKVRDGDGFQFWRLIAFSESIGDELLRLCDGDSVSVQGALRAEPYEKDGQTRIGFTLIASQVLVLRGAKKKAQAPDRSSKAADRREDRTPEPSKRHAMDRYGGGCADPALDDEIPF